VLGLAACDLWLDAALAQLAAVLVVVIAAIGYDALGASSRPSDAPAHGRDRVDQRDQLGDVVAVAAGDRIGEWNPAGVYQEMMLGAVAGPINRARARRGAPFLACT